MLLDDFLKIMRLFMGGEIFQFILASALQFLPDVEIILQQFLLRLISASDMVTSALVGHQLAMGLDHHSVEVFHSLRHIRGHGVARPQGQSVPHQTLDRTRICHCSYRLSSDTYLLLNIFCHTCRVLRQTFRIDHAIECIRCDSEGEGDILTVAQHTNIQNNVIFCNSKIFRSCHPGDCTTLTVFFFLIF